jgi:hypothetical protein
MPITLLIGALQAFSKKMIAVSGYAAQQAKEPLTPYSFERREPRVYSYLCMKSCQKV